MEVSVNDLFSVIGQQAVEIILLKAKISALETKVASLSNDNVKSDSSS